MDRCPQCKHLLPHPGNCDRPLSASLPPLDPDDQKPRSFQRLSAAKVKEIKALIDEGRVQLDIANRAEVSVSSVQRVARGEV